MYRKQYIKYNYTFPVSLLLALSLLTWDSAISARSSASSSSCCTFLSLARWALACSPCNNHQTIISWVAATPTPQAADPSSQVPRPDYYMKNISTDASREGLSPVRERG